MPAIRDWTYNYGTVVTATTISCELPDYQQDDLLLAICSTDLGAQTWSLAGWTQLFSVTNTSNLAVLYKIAGASESDPTFTYTNTETANVALVAIKDVNITTPIDGYTTANNTVARTATPTRTATNNNSLNIYCWNHGAIAVIPSIIEGPVTQIVAKDGSAHSDGFAWNFQPASGTTPSDIYWTVSGTTYDGLIAVITINPPSGGATVIPTHCASDSSIYVDPIHGVTAFQGNTAWGETATTYFGTTLAGRTLANTATIARVDYGINSYRSAGGMSGPTTANTWRGGILNLAVANKPNVTGKNILLHAVPYLPADIQTVYNVGLSKGIAVGMYSSANNCKTWHVHGFGTAWGVKRTPVIINSSNTSGVIDTQGTFDPSSVAGFGCFTCGFLVSSDWVWTMIWVLGITVVAGGNTAIPININEIVNVVATGHERMSVVQQATNQMLVLQPIQIGNGGTNPTYLDLDATAIEFPEIYNTATKQVYYCSVDNIAEIIYYPGASDTIKHRNSVISGKSRFKWGLHASASTSATYDFGGTSVINAGTITLNKAIVVDNLTINNYSTIDASGLTLTNSVIKGCPIGNDTITLTTASNIDYCNINTIGITSGNRWCSITDPTIFTGSTFTSDTSSGHAMRITSPGTYSFSGNVFNSYGIIGGNTAAIYNDSTGLVTLNITNGGSIPTYRNGAGASTVVNNLVTLKITVVDKLGGGIQNAQTAIYKISDNTELMNQDTNASGIAETTFNYVTDTNIYVRIRKSSTGITRYFPIDASGTIITSGYISTFTLIEDAIASS